MQNIINFLLALSIPLAAALFAYAGFLYVSGGSNPSKITRAHKIFKDVLIGFLIVISGWLVINTILTVVFDKGFLDGRSWFELQCISSRGPNDGQRLDGRSISDLLKLVIPDVKPPVYNVTPTCPSGYAFMAETGQCFNGTNGASTPPTLNVTQVTGDVSTGLCAPNSIFGGNANLMSCICGAESAGVVNRPSGSDVIQTGEAFSWGLYQINLTVNPIMCPGQPVLNCPDAFNGTNYSATISNPTLYAQCVAAASNQACNASTAVYLLNETPNGARNWSTYNQCARR